MKFMFREKGSLEVLLEVPGRDILIGSIVLRVDGVYCYLPVCTHIAIAGIHLQQIAAKLSELNRSWMEAEFAPQRIIYL